MKIPGIVVRLIFVLCVPVLLLTASLGCAANSLWLYKYGFQKYNVRQTLALSGVELTDSGLEEIYSGLISYYNSAEEYVNFTVTKYDQPSDLFTNEESIHFRDVKGLIRLDYGVLLGTMIYVLGYIVLNLLWRKPRNRRHLAWSVFGGGILTLALMLALGLGITLGFDRLFLVFHLVSFSNEFWSVQGNMVQLFPVQFFYDAAMFCVLAIAAGAVILGGVSGGYLLITRRREDLT